MASIVATPTFTIDTAGGPSPITGTGSMAVARPGLAATGVLSFIGTAAMAVAVAMAGTGTMTPPTITGTGSLAVTAPSLAGSGTATVAGITGTGSLAVPIPTLSGTSPFAAQRAAIIAGLDSAQSEGTGWDAIVKVAIPVQNVVRTSDTVVTITLPAFGSYDITATETITATVPSAALVSGGPLVATPTFTVTTGDITGTGSLAVAKPSLAGTGTVISPVTGTGSLAVPIPKWAFGDRIAVPVPSISGTGTVANGVSGSGSLAVAKPAIAASGTNTPPAVTGTGSLAVAQPSMSGSGGQGSFFAGSGSLAVVTPSLAATGTNQQQVSGSGSLAVAVPSLSGTDGESPPPVPEPAIGAGSRRGGGRALYADRMAAEADARAAARKPIDSLVAPAAPTRAAPDVVERPRHVTALEPVDLDEHDRELALLRGEPDQVEPVAVGEAVVVESDEFAGYTEAAFDALRARAQAARDRETQIVQSRAGLYALGKKVPVVHISPVAYATALAEAQRQFIDDEELAMVLLIAS